MRFIATVLCFLCILYLFWIDQKRNEVASKAIWIPFFWMFFAGSHFASQWLNLGQSIDVSSQTLSEGSPLDRNVFLILILSGTWVLNQRKLNWADLLVKNIWIWMFFFFGAISTFWAEDSLLSFKRWIKGIGNLVMAMIILTESRPVEALGFVLRRLGFLLLPLSVLFIKYFPEFGRSYHMGMPMFSGATYGKNALGQFCLIVGIYYCWKLLLRHDKLEVPGFRLHFTIYIITIPIIIWLLYMANSATSLTCMIIAVIFLLFARLPIIIRNSDKIFSIGLISIIVFVALEYFFGIKENIILLLGRRPDLTDRDVIWKIVLSMSENALIGSGYESFWTGNRIIKIWQLLGVEGILQAHNGYIEVYLNQGIIGLVLLLGGIITGLLKIRKRMNSDYVFSIFKITFILVVLFYNYTEAMFVPVSNLFVLLLFGIIDVNQRVLDDNIKEHVKTKSNVAQKHYRYYIDKN